MTFKEFYIEGKKVKELYINGKKAKIGEPVPEDMLGFKAVDGAVGLSLSQSGEPDAVSLETSFDGAGWTTWDLTEITIPEGSTLYVRRTDDNPSNKFSTTLQSYYKFSTTGTGKLEVHGSVQYLLGKSGTRTDTPAYCYVNAFKGCTTLTQAPTLPATTLGVDCYYGMFASCSSLTEAPELPATILANECYSNMFENCSSLAEAPDLPARTMTNACYRSMFSNCKSLRQAPELPATTLANNCYTYMFYGCTALTQAPELPATTLVQYCYSGMFYDCSDLTSMKVAFKSWGTQTNNWLKNVASTGTFICPQALINATTTRTTSTVPSGWNMVAI